MTRVIDECTDVERLQEVAKIQLNHAFQLQAALDEVTVFARKAVTHAGKAIATLKANQRKCN